MSGSLKHLQNIFYIFRQVNDETERSPTMSEFVRFIPNHSSSEDSFETLSVLELAEQLTYIDHKLFKAIPFW